MFLTNQKTSPYQSYAYAYPHKSAYRDFETPVDLADLWSSEDKSSLFLYVHIPFCEMRCGFCNLFTVAKPPEDLPERYVDRLLQQMEITAGFLGEARFTQAAIGGGTPTLLSAKLLQKIFEGLKSMGATLPTLPMTVETSPKTAIADRLAVLADYGTTRVSIGVQTFHDSESRRLARPQNVDEVMQALQTIAASEVPECNIDLIYGIETQTIASFKESITQALSFTPAEIFLYPLYVRPLTGLGLSQRQWDDHRQELYRAGRDYLLANGYTQISMRCFRSTDLQKEAVDYSCQTDGMVGLGTGARSYTTRLHYSSDYAVERSKTVGVIDSYIASAADSDTFANHGVVLSLEDQQRRDIIKSVLRTEGLDIDRFKQRFMVSPLEAAPQLQQFIDNSWLQQNGSHIAPTEEGLAWSDFIGPSLFSNHVQQLSASYEAQ